MRERPERQRLHKYLADLGVASRRKIEILISDGRIRVNGRQAEPGDKILPGTPVSIDGRPLAITGSGQADTSRRVILYNKPEGEICTRSDPDGRPTVFRNLPRLKSQRWVSVGRLDINTSGLLLFTNDGTLANRLMHPRLGIEREYLCRVFGDVDRSKIARLTRGIDIDGKLHRFLAVRRHGAAGRNTWFSVTLTEGRYREVRKLWQAAGCRISRLNRIRYGKVRLPRGLASGDWIELDANTVAKLASNDAHVNAVVPEITRRRHCRQQRRADKCGGVRR